MDKKFVKAQTIGVNCTENDPVDVRCGGPEYLGFDFHVKSEEVEEMKIFIATALNAFDLPLINITVSKTFDLDSEYIWTKEKIVEEMSKESEFIRMENYRKILKNNRTSSRTYKI